MTDTIWGPDLSQSEGPKYLALTGALRRAIRDGQLQPGEKLPPVRDMAWRLGMTPGTVARAYQLATQEGLLSGEVGRGTFVTGVLRPRQTPLIEQPPPRGQVDLRWPALTAERSAEAASFLDSRLRHARFSALDLRRERHGRRPVRHLQRQRRHQH